MDIYSVIEQYQPRITKFQKKYFEENPSSEWPMCPCGCDRPVLLNYTKPNSLFRQYASAECSRKSKTIPKEINNILSNKDWLYEQRFILKKSKELIAEELGISSGPINKWLKIHNIDYLKLSESDHKVQEFLDNKEFLENEYNKGKTLEEIAKAIGSSKSTVSIKFNEYNIETKEPNSYDRKSFSSKEEMQVYDWIRSILPENIEVKHRDRKTIGSELDIYIPELNIAVEYNGIYTHLWRPNAKSESSQKGPKFHLNKTIACEKQGIQLIHIFSDQWNKNQSAVKTILMAKLGANKTIFARKCEIRTPSVHEKNQFLDSYHLQSADKSKYHFGLYYSDELVALMTFGSSRYNKNYKWELIRYCGKFGISVVGGFSKLLKHFMKNHNGSIISYADRCYSDGGVYEMNGFSLTKINRPGYYYVNLNKGSRINRRMYTKKRILQLIGITSSLKSEAELTEELGLKKIFDCGTLTYTIDR